MTFLFLENIEQINGTLMVNICKYFLVNTISMPLKKELLCKYASK